LVGERQLGGSGTSLERLLAADYELVVCCGFETQFVEVGSYACWVEEEYAMK
jgi:hypothetical protein